jgi:hypothetical protein
MEQMDSDLVYGVGPIDLEVASINHSELDVGAKREKGNVTATTSTPDTKSFER